MLSLIVTLVVGALIGWIASMIMKTDAQQGAVWNILIGIIGSALGGWLFGDILGWGGAKLAGDFSIAGLFWGVIGACVLIFLLKALKVLK